MIRRCAETRCGWDHGDLDIAFQMFSCGMVWDGNLTSKESRDHFVRNGYAVRHDGMQSLTGKGTVAFLCTPRVWRSAWSRWRGWERNPLVADAARVRRAMT
jgi:hypothetical protein